MNRYVLTTEAHEDLRKIRDYLLSEGGARAARYFKHDDAMFAIV
jgi:plasmid stabilization system protein ParE